MAAVYIRPLHCDRKRNAYGTVLHRLAYYRNPVKTEEEKYVTGFGCSPESAAAEFMLTRQAYRQKTGREMDREHDILAYQVRQSFKPGEITAEEANRLGMELAQKLTKENCQFVVCTHVDKNHIHNHILINSIRMDGTGKFRNPIRSIDQLQKISDRICKENGLSVIEKSEKKGKSYKEWLERRKGTSWKEKLREDLSSRLEKAGDLPDLLSQMKTAGYEIKEGKNLSFRAPGQTRFMRMKTLGPEFEDGIVLSRFAKPAEKIDRLIDLETSRNAEKGRGFEIWARKQNVKLSAQSMLFLEQCGWDLHALSDRAESAKTSFTECREKLKGIEKQIKTLLDLKKHLSNYGDTKAVYQAYKQSGFSAKYYREHETDLLLHKAAKKYFDSLGRKKLPGMQSIQKELASLYAEKGKIYKEYTSRKDQWIQLENVRQNLERLMGEQPQKERKKEQAR